MATLGVPGQPVRPYEGILREEVFRHVEQISGFGVWTWDAGTGKWSWSDQVFRIFGLPTDSAPLSTEAYLDMVPAGERGYVAEVLRGGLRSADGYTVEHKIVLADGTVRTLEIRGRAVFDGAGTVVYALGTVQDVTEVRITSAELRRVRDLFAGVLESATEQSIIALDAKGMITVFNAGAEKMLGWKAEEIVGVHSPPMLHDTAEVEARAAELGIEPDYRVIVGRAARGEVEARRWTYVTKDRRRLQAMVTTTAIRDLDGDISGYIKVGTDITAQVEALEALRANEALFEDIFNYAPTGMLLTDMSDANHDRIIRTNPAMSRITGYSQEELIGTSVFDLTHDDHADDYRAAYQAMISGRVEANENERRWLHADGRDIWVKVSATSVRETGSRLVVAMVEDITARKRAEERLNHLALHDALTGLPNRTLLFDRLDHALAASARSKLQVAVIFLDLDGFKAVNDAAGHLVGDKLLLVVADRLRAHLRPGDTVSRMGGDEFVLVCPGLAPESAMENTRRLAGRLLALLAEPYQLGSAVFHLSASIGLAVSEFNSTAASMIRAADDAMYAAKDNGKNRVHHSGSEDMAALGRSARAARHLTVEKELRAALERNELVMHGQPVFDLATKQIIAIETLIRWQHPARGLLPPADFLDVAENSPLMTQIGRRVLDESCRIAALLTPTKAELYRPPIVYVNISGRQLESGNLRNDVLHALDSSRLDPHRLVLELTETFTPLIAGSLLEDLEYLRGLGVRLAIDDVGTGYSSLSRFTELPIDILKIDRSFVARIGQNSAVDAVISAILNIGQSLNLDVIAEGVETRHQEDLLDELGCRIVQGFLYSKPRPEAVLRNIVGTVDS